MCVARTHQENLLVTRGVEKRRLRDYGRQTGHLEVKDENLWQDPNGVHGIGKGLTLNNRIVSVDDTTLND